jgi:cytochrome c-type biogenesis protein CcmH
LRSRVKPTDVLFVVAKSRDGGPPYAALRTRAENFPLEFKLDDSMAMMPGHNLTSAETVVVEARVSRSGDAMPRSGDLRAKSGSLRVTEAPHLRLTISEVVP